MLVGRRRIDLFDDSPRNTDAAAARPARASLVCTLILVILFMASMTLPWFHSGETPPWTAFSHWLNLGWSPGTQRWGFLLLTLATALATATGLTIRMRRRALFVLLPAFAAALVILTVLETSAHLSVNPGPLLQADFGAWIGDGLAVCVLVAAVAAAMFGIPKRSLAPQIVSRRPSQEMADR